MDIGPLRALVLELNADVLGVPVTVTYEDPEIDAITARGIWVTPTTDDYPAGLSGIRRREPRRVLALNVVDFQTVPKGSIIDAAPPGGSSERWRVDGYDRIEADQIRVTVVPDPSS